MSIQKRTRKKGHVYVVHFYDTDRKKYINKTFSRRTDATAFESVVNLAKRRGELAELDAGQETLTVFLEEWWSRHGDRFLAENTKVAYRSLQKRFINKHLGDLPLRRITPSAIVAMRDKILDESGDETARKTIAFLQGVLERAVEWERIRINPVKAVKKPAQQRQSRPRVLDPAGVERLVRRIEMDHPRQHEYSCLLRLMAYAGLRPGEALGLEWGDVGESTLDINKSVALGRVGRTKTGRSRVVRLLDPLKEDLNRFRLASGSRTGRLVSRKDGGPWRDTDYRNWRKRVFQPAAAILEGVAGGAKQGNGRNASTLRPYDLRHSFASLLFHEGRNPAYIAEQMGHSIQTLLSTYIHVIEELRDAERQDAEQLIREARTSRPTGLSQSSG